MASRTAHRHLVLRRLLDERPVRSQEGIVEALGDLGHRVSQATVSRDLAAIGAERRETEDGPRYVVSQEPVPDARLELGRVMASFVTSIDASGNLALVKTHPGTANTVAQFLDRGGVEGLLGTVAGDDTLLAVAAAGTPGAALAERLERLLEI